MFAGTPYAHDALGTRPSFEKTTAQMLKSFHDTWYAPNNAILVIAGNVDPEATLSEVKQLFGDIPAKKLPPKPQVRLRPVQPTSFTVDTDQPARHADDRDAHARAARCGFRGARGARGRARAATASSSTGSCPQGKATGAEFALDPLPEAGLAYAALSFTSGR